MNPSSTQRILAFSDVHGNTPALQALLSMCDDIQPDLIVNLGDIASGGVDPRGTLDLLSTRPDILTVRGNHERQLLTNPHPAHGGSDWLATQVLTPADRLWLGSLPQMLEIAPGVLAFHGSPDNDVCYLLETVDPSVPAVGLRPATDHEVMERLGSWAGKSQVFLCGHTHIQRTKHLPDGSFVVNPGSLGWPAYEDDEPYPHRNEAGTPHARFSVVDRTEQGWKVTEHAIDYDVDQASALAESNSRPDVAKALRTGRV